MSNERFTQLVREFCELVRIDDPAAVIESGSVLVNDIAFSLFHGGADPADGQAQDAMTVFCDFGPVPEKDAQAVLRRLLEVNLFLSGAPAANGFAINPESGHVLLCFKVVLDGTDAATLSQSFALCAQEAQRWRESHFLDEAAEPARASSPGLGQLLV